MKKIALILVMTILFGAATTAGAAEGKTVSLQVVEGPGNGIEREKTPPLVLEYVEDNHRLYLDGEGLKVLLKALDTKDIAFRMFTNKAGAIDQEVNIYKFYLSEGKYKGIGFCLDGISLNGGKLYDFLSDFNGRAWYYGDRYYYPLRAICEYLGYSVSWIESENTIILE